MDNDISHAVEARLQAIEERLDKLDPPTQEGNGTEPTTDQPLYDPSATETPEETTTSSRSSRSRS